MTFRTYASPEAFKQALEQDPVLAGNVDATWSPGTWSWR